jgi:hypothetical protein
MRYKDVTGEDIEQLKPKSPEQQRIANLKHTADAAKQQVKAERDQQKVAKAQRTIASVHAPKKPQSQSSGTLKAR